MGALAFTSPWILAALLALPAIYWLIRAVPPPPRRQAFPAVMLLRRLTKGEPPPRRTPPWLLILRLLAAGLLVIALAGPILNPASRLPGQGPVVLVLDNGWQAASRFADRLARMETILRQAIREDRAVVLLETAPPYGGWPEAVEAPAVDRPAAVLARLDALSPRPFAPDHARTAAMLAQLPRLDSVYILSDGLKHAGTADLEQQLNRAGEVTVYADDPARPPLALLPVEQRGFAFDVRAVRPDGSLPVATQVQARARDGRILATVPLAFEADSLVAAARLDLPQQLRNEVARIQLTAGDSAGTTLVLDSRSRRPVIGLAAGDPADRPLQSQRYYLERALEPYAELVPGEPAELIASDIDILLAADIGTFANPAAVRRFVAEGGLLIRFAGPRLSNGADDLVPVPLRRRDRSFGGALSWEEPQALARFSEDSPFAGLVPPDDLIVRRQVLARPDPRVVDRSWASLADGTPVVTAAQEGQGWIVLFHITANADWSDLPLSGLFVDMLRRLLPLAQAQGRTKLSGSLPLYRMMDGYGALGRADPRIGAIAAERLRTAPVGASLPPGLYGSADAPYARNLMSDLGPIDAAFRFDPIERPTVALGRQATERDLKPLVLTLVLILLTVDLIASLMLRGLTPAAARAAMLVGLLLPLSLPAPAVEERFAVEATEETRLGYVRTGNARQDQLSEAGLRGLGLVLARRTAVRLGPPQPLDPAQDPLNLFPFIYWPVPADASVLSPAAQERVNAYLRSGGIILFDTGAGDPLSRSRGLSDPEREAALRRLLGPLDIPRLKPVDRSHVLSKSFYLLDQFPGRITGRPVWVSSEADADRVSPLIVGGGDWASAWRRTAA